MRCFSKNISASAAVDLNACKQAFAELDLIGVLLVACKLAFEHDVRLEENRLFCDAEFAVASG